MSDYEEWSQEDLAEHLRLIDWHCKQLWEFIRPGRHAVIRTHIVDGKIVRVVPEESRIPPKIEKKP